MCLLYRLQSSGICDELSNLCQKVAVTRDTQHLHVVPYVADRYPEDLVELGVIDVEVQVDIVVDLLIRECVHTTRDI
jgi:hypothetical protein